MSEHERMTRRRCCLVRSESSTEKCVAKWADWLSYSLCRTCVWFSNWEEKASLFLSPTVCSHGYSRHYKGFIQFRSTSISLPKQTMTNEARNLLASCAAQAFFIRKWCRCVGNFLPSLHSLRPTKSKTVGRNESQLWLWSRSISIERRHRHL